MPLSIFRWFIPVVCAIIDITNECKINASQNTTIILCGGNQVNDNMFRPIHLFPSGQNLVTKEEFYNAYSVIQYDVDVNEISFLSYKPCSKYKIYVREFA
jgi:hypothetical protein